MARTARRQVAQAWWRRLGCLLLALFLSPLALAAPPPGPGPTQPGQPPPEFPPGSVVPATAPIRLPGGGGVSDTGAATYSLPLQVPAGPLGMQPLLSLAYGGGKGNGSLGVGFSLAGLSAITPCHQSFASGGHADGVDFDSLDDHCLDGAKLVRTEDEPLWSQDPLALPGAKDVVLTTEAEGFVRVKAHWNSGVAKQPASFKVFHPDGRVSTYDQPVYGWRYRGVDAVEPPALDTAGSDEEAKVVVAYPITSIEDRSGNRIEFEYLIDESPASYQIAAINYSFSGSGVPRRKIVFHYEARPDPQIRYLSGVKLGTPTRLGSIDVYAPNPEFPDVVWSYELGYDLSPDTFQSRLTSVVMKDQFGSESWVRGFQWSEANASVVDRGANPPEFDDKSWWDDKLLRKADFLWEEEDGSFVHLWVDFDGTWRAFNYPDKWVDSDVRLVVADFDGDGIDDVLYRTHPTRLARFSWHPYNPEPGFYPVSHRHDYERGSIRLRRSTDGGALNHMVDLTEYFEPSQLLVPPPVETWGEELWVAHLGKSRVADFDHDGRADLMLVRTKIDHDLVNPWVYTDQVPEDACEYPEDEECEPEDDALPILPFFGRWWFGHANVGPFDPAMGSFQPGMANLVGKVTVKGPLSRGSSTAPMPAEWFLFTPPHQHVVADLDGDGRPEGVDAFFYGPHINIRDYEFNPFDAALADVHEFAFKTELTTDGAATTRLFAGCTNLDPSPDCAAGSTFNSQAYWECGNSRALVLDYEGDGRDDVLIATDDEVDPHVEATGRYLRLSTQDGSIEPAGPTVARATSDLWGGDCGKHLPDLLTGDFNGDGLTDVLYPPGSYVDGPPVCTQTGPDPGDVECEVDPNSAPKVRWNLGNGFANVADMPVDDPALGALMENPQPLDWEATGPVGWDLGTRVVDLNRDGRDDIVAIRFEAGSHSAVPGDYILDKVHAPKVVIAYLSTGDGLVARKLGVWNAEFSWWEGFTSFQVGDVTGDGAVDLVHVDEGSIVTTELPWRESPDLLEAVTDSGSAYPLELFSYDSAWWGTGPRPEPAPCQYPWSCSRRSFPVVRSHAVFQGTMPEGGRAIARRSTPSPIRARIFAAAASWALGSTASGIASSAPRRGGCSTTRSASTPGASSIHWPWCRWRCAPPRRFCHYLQTGTCPGTQTFRG